MKRLWESMPSGRGMMGEKKDTALLFWREFGNTWNLEKSKLKICIILPWTQKFHQWKSIL